MIKKLLQNNKDWVKKVNEETPGLFDKLSKHQSPEYLWIGCSDSRLPPNEIIGLLPGELFVHRNVANVVVYTDFNCLSVVEYAVMVLGVKHIIICGHYGCGGIKGALTRSGLELSDNWLNHIRDVYQKHRTLLDEMKDETLQWDKLCELNVIEQAYNLANTTVMYNAWKADLDVTVHGWIYSLKDGLLRDLKDSVSGFDEIEGRYKAAVAQAYKMSADKAS